MVGLLRGRSLRFWVALGMGVALAPLALSAGAGYMLLDRGVVAPFNDVAARQRQQVIPAQHLRLLIWETLTPVDEYVEEGNALHVRDYRSLRAGIETGFANLDRALGDETAARAVLRRARDDWATADGYATELVSVPGPAGDPARIRMLERYHGEIASANDRLEAVYGQLADDIRADHDEAILFYERSLWLAGIAGAASLLAMALGVTIVGRILSASVDRLVKGAVRFAEGDRSHRIEVQVPPELHRVAEEFNHMIGRIHESEAVLAELAHRDSLTGPRQPPRLRRGIRRGPRRHRPRHGDQAALLALDIDHFKRTNDTHGHAAGDEVLRTVARVMTQTLRPCDKAFRTGGEEFVVLLPRTGAAEAAGAGDRLRRAVAATPVPFGGAEIGATVSIGVAEAAERAEQAMAMKAADAALYQAKQAGRNRVVVSGADARNRGAA